MFLAEQTNQSQRLDNEGIRMSTEIKMRTIICLIAGLLVVCVHPALAATEEKPRAEEKPTVTVSLSQLNTELRNLRENLSRTIAALQNVKSAANKNADLSKPFATFSSAWAEFDAQIAKVRQDGIATRARAKEHWEAWHSELINMQNPELREKAEKRYASTTKEFEKISEKVADAKEDFAPLEADLKDVHTYLKTDLSRDAVSSLSSTIWKMGNQAHTVDGELADISKQIERTLSKLPQN
jgi:predicted  nucleic acid-binding Zn-ribbon protein